MRMEDDLSLGGQHAATLRALRVMRLSVCKTVQKLAIVLETCQECQDRCPGIMACRRAEKPALLVFPSNSSLVFNRT
jgi:hypothetical protein